MAGTVYSKFFWQDWAADPCLGQCSFAAKGLWMDLLCLAAQSEPIGHVKIGNKVPSPEHLARHLRAPMEEVSRLLEELISNGVCDRGRDGVLVSRRMVRDARKQRARASGGRESSSLSQRNEKGNFTSRDDPFQLTAPATINHQPSTRVQSPSTKAFELAFETWWKTYPKKEAKKTAKRLYLAILKKGEATVEELQAGVERYADERSADVSISKINAKYTKHPTTWLNGGCWTDDSGVPVAVIHAAPVDVDWKTTMRHLLAYGHWPESVGPSPFEEGCRAPPEMLTMASEWWERNNRTPSDPMTRTPWVPRPFWGANVVPLRAAEGRG